MAFVVHEMGYVGLTIEGVGLLEGRKSRIKEPFINGYQSFARIGEVEEGSPRRGLERLLEQGWGPFSRMV